MMSYLPGRRLRFTEELDLMLLNQVVDINPWARRKGEGWMTVALNLQELPGFHGRVFPRSVRDRVNLLMEKFSATKAELEDTGQECFSEKEDLLMKCVIQKENAAGETAKTDATHSELFEDIEIDDVEGNRGNKVKDEHALKQQLLVKMIHLKEDSLVSGGVVMNGKSLQILPRESQEDSAESQEESAQPVNSTTLEEIEHSDFTATTTSPPETGTPRKGRKRKRHSKRDLMTHLLEKEIARENERREELEIKRAELKLAQDRLELDIKLRQKEMDLREIREKKELEIRMEREKMEMDQRRREMEMREGRHKHEMELRQDLHRLEMEQRKQEIRLKEETERLAQEERRFYLCVLQKMNDAS